MQLIGLDRRLAYSPPLSGPKSIDQLNIIGDAYFRSINECEQEAFWGLLMLHQCTFEQPYLPDKLSNRHRVTVFLGNQFNPAWLWLSYERANRRRSVCDSRTCFLSSSEVAVDKARSGEDLSRRPEETNALRVGRCKISTDKVMHMEDFQTFGTSGTERIACEIKQSQSNKCRNININRYKYQTDRREHDFQK